MQSREYTKKKIKNIMSTTSMLTVRKRKVHPKSVKTNPETVPDLVLGRPSLGNHLFSILLQKHTEMFITQNESEKECFLVGYTTVGLNIEGVSSLPSVEIN